MGILVTEGALSLTDWLAARKVLLVLRLATK